MTRLPEIRAEYVGDPARYFYGVARFVIMEAIRRREIATDVAPSLPLEVDVHSAEYDCLIQCLKFLANDKREMIIDYYVYDGHDKIAHHKLMASELSISEGALRGRAHHLRSNLEKCILKCVETTKAKQKRPSEP